jgi:N-acetylglucosamine-6-sulfatase
VAVRMSAAFALFMTGFSGLTTTGAANQVSDISPNFVFILTDDQRWDTIGRCLGGFDGSDLAAGADACMPHVQEDLIARGVTFLRGYVTNALCCPSRASYLTGRYSRHTGVVTNNGFPQFDDSSTFATWLDDAGYRTGFVGKYLNGYGQAGTPPNYIPPGWDSWHTFWGQADYHRYSLVEADPGSPAGLNSYDTANSTDTRPCSSGNLYSTDLFCARAKDFLAADASTPFLLHFAPFAPHLPAAPAPGRGAALSDVQPPTYPNHNVVPGPNPPSYLPDDPLTGSRIAKVRSEFVQQLQTNLAVDDAVHAIHEQLTADGRRDNTVFVFASDNGFARGEHRWEGKQCEYEVCHHVPFVIACPPAVCPTAAEGTVDAEHFVLNLDIAPTIAELAGLKPPDWTDGVSLVTLLNGAGDGWRSSFVIDDPRLNDIHGIVSTEGDGHTYKYVELLGGAERELFDLTTDPWEVENLAGDGVHAATQAALTAALHSAITPTTITITSGPQGATGETTVSFTWTTDEAATFGCSLDSAVPDPCGAGTEGSVTYQGVADGPHVFSINAMDSDNNQSSAQRSFTVAPPDTTTPTVTMKKPGNDDLLKFVTVSASWSGTDDVGISRYDVYERMGTTGAQALVQSSTRVNYSRTGNPGATYCYQVFAFDAAGNQGAGVERCAAVPHDDRSASIFYAGAVGQVDVSGPFQGTLSVLDGSGESAELSCTCRRIGILARKDPASGKVQVWVDGVLKATVDLYRATTTDKVYVYMTTLALGPHTVQLTWTGTKNPSSSGSDISLDGIGVVG